MVELVISRETTSLPPSRPPALNHISLEGGRQCCKINRIQWFEIFFGPSYRWNNISKPTSSSTSFLTQILTSSARPGQPGLLDIQKLRFFTIYCSPSLAYIVVRDLQSSQCNTSVQSLLLVGKFLYNQQRPSGGEGEVANFREFLEKTQYLMNTL